MKGKTLDTLVRESKDTHDDGLVYGGQTLQVFSNMGWRTVLNDADQSSTSIQFDEDAIKYPREIIALVPAKFTVPSNAAGTVNDGDGPQSGATVDHRRQWLLASLMLLLSLL